MEKERDTYKYRLALDGRTILRDTTYDLVRREAEHQARYPGSRVAQVGRRTTRKAALAWLRKQKQG